MNVKDVRTEPYLMANVGQRNLAKSVLTIAVVILRRLCRRKTNMSNPGPMLQNIESMINKMFRHTVMPRYRYWQFRNHVFGWNTEPTSNGKFCAFIYRVTKRSWKLVRKVEFGRRKIAKARALKWYQQRKAKWEAKRKVIEG